MKKTPKFKVGRVCLVGRPNVGKSTLLNALVGQKVAIVTPKPQTTQSQIEAFYEDERGQIFFLDTPGFFASNSRAKRYNFLIKESLEQADIIVYVVDKSKAWGEEDERVFMMLENYNQPKILIINKIDIKHPDYTDTYLTIIQPNVDHVLQLSATTSVHLKGFLNLLFDLLPERPRDTSVDHFVSPLLSQSSSEYLAELVREKIYLTTGEEVPYQTYVRITDINDQEDKLSIKGIVYVTDKRYKPILIGKNARKIKQISEAVTKELKVITNKPVSIRLQVEVE